jgi:large subunit ribosomal protein L6
VGYRAFSFENFENHLLILRLGYSHPIYFKIPPKIKIFSLKLTKLFLYSYSYQQLTSTTSKICLNKIPKPYKGKGILCKNKTITLKEGKRFKNMKITTLNRHNIKLLRLKKFKTKVYKHENF